MHYIKLEGSYYSMGKKMAQHFINNNSKFPIQLNKFQLKHGIESIELIKQFYPEILEEIKGITDTLNFNFEQFASWLLCMGCCLTIRKNHNVEIRGCTAMGIITNNKIFYARNNDLPPYLKQFSKSITYSPCAKNKFVLNTSSFINGEEGINQHGLIVAMTFVIPNKNEIKPGFNSLFLVRYLLEHCKNVEEAIQALNKLPIASSCNILLIDKQKNMVVVECCPFTIHIRKAQINNNGDKFNITVNHFTSKNMQNYDKSNQNVYASANRYHCAYNCCNSPKSKITSNYLKEVLKGKYGFMCQYKRIKFETIWSTIIDVNKQTLYLCDTSPLYGSFKKFKLFV